MNPDEKFNKYKQGLAEILNEVRMHFIDVMNKGSDTTQLMASIQKLNELRKFVNTAEKIGFVVGFKKWEIGLFPLTGDPEKDLEQTDPSISKKDFN